MKIFRKLTTKILVFSSVFFALTIALFCFLILNNISEPQQPITNSEVYKDFCGTKKLSEADKEGKQIFNNTCAACHKLDANMTGPALRNIDSIVFNKWLNNKKYQINKAKINQFSIDYHLDLSRKNFKESDLKKIYAYIGK